MIDAALIDTLEEVYALESTSFVRYIIWNAEIQVDDDFDRKVRSFLKDWCRTGDLNRTAFVELLSEQDHIVETYSYPIRYSEYHYLKASYLLRPAVRFMTDTLAEIEARSAGLAGWPRARQLVDAVVERERPFLERAKELEAQSRERPSPEAPPKIKGSSASRW